MENNGRTEQVDLFPLNRLKSFAVEKYGVGIILKNYKGLRNAKNKVESLFEKSAGPLFGAAVRIVRGGGKEKADIVQAFDNYGCCREGDSLGQDPQQTVNRLIEVKSPSIIRCITERILSFSSQRLSIRIAFLVRKIGGGTACRGCQAHTRNFSWFPGVPKGHE